MDAILLNVTSSEIIGHWRKGAFDALEVAKLVFQAEKFEHTLFNCQLAVEKALKVLYMRAKAEDAPRTHNLVYLAELLELELTDQDQELLNNLSDFAVDARYNDPIWAQEQATRENAEGMLSAVEVFHSTYLP